MLKIGVDSFSEVWYTNGRRKNSTQGELFDRLTVRGSNIFGLDCRFKKWADHTFDHLQTWTVWKQCEREHQKALISDTKAPKSRKNHLKIKCATLRDVEVASSHSPPEARQARLSGVGRGYHGAKRSYLVTSTASNIRSLFTNFPISS